MSRNITIQEGDVGRTFTTNKLKTDLAGGGTCLWVPKNDVQLGTKNITENGTYKASKDGFYGYSQVTVNVQGGGDTITGKDPATGQETVVGTDPTTGEIVETVVPTEIRVITPPTNPYGTYLDGQTITKDGMVVKAYDANGDEMQTVPIGEITINPTTASIDEAEIRGGGNIEGIPIINIALETAEYSVSVPSQFTVGNVTFKGEEASPAYGDRFEMSAHGAQYGWYFSKNSFPVRVKLWVVSNAPGTYPQCTISDKNGSVLKTTGYLSDFVYTPGGLPRYYQTITVSWPRPGDGKTLETTFDILVGPRAGQGDD